MHDVEHLPLVLVQTLDLDVEEGVRVHVDAVGMGDILGKTQLVVPLDGGQTVQDRLVVGAAHQILQPIGVLGKAVADQFLQQGGQFRVGLAEPAAVGDAVGDVQEPLRRVLVVVVEDGLFEDLGVQGADAVDLVAGGQAEIMHPHLVVGDDRHPV